MKNNNHKKEVFQDNSIRKYCCSARNHPSGWKWWKRRTVKTTRKKLNNELDKEKDLI